MNRDQPHILEYHKGTSVDHLQRFESAWRALWPRDSGRPWCLLTTCSHAKPYHKSYIHSMIRQELWVAGLIEKTDIVHVSSAGIIPSECGSDYPFCAYDWNDEEATEEERAAYVQCLPERLEYWFGRTGYDRVFAYFQPEDDNLKVLALHPRIRVLPTVQTAPVPWTLEPDVDDCLASVLNMGRLRALRHY